VFNVVLSCKFIQKPVYATQNLFVQLEEHRLFFYDVVRLGKGVDGS
jgi:hypothetical protein